MYKIESRKTTIEIVLERICSNLDLLKKKYEFSFSPGEMTALGEMLKHDEL